jgi:hypothetical protein
MSGQLWLVILLGSAAVIVAANWWQGLWSNMVTLVNMFLAALVATSFYRNVANAMLNVDESWKLIADFVSIWLLFAVVFIFFRSITETLSKYRLRFDSVTELVGRSILSLAIGALYFTFTSYTLVIAPLPLEHAQAFDNKNIYPESAWASAIDYMSRNSLAASPTSAWFGDISSGENCRPAGGINDLKEFGDQIRFRISDQTNLRMPVPEQF